MLGVYALSLDAGLRPRRSDFSLIWYAVAAIVLFALGVTILLGAIAWCSAHGEFFGVVYKASTFTYSVGCHR